MFRNRKGFTLLETVAAITTLFVSLIIIIPSFVLIQQERKQLYTELEIIDHLSMEMKTNDFHETRFPFQFAETISGSKAFYHFKEENNLIKGCVQWETNQKKETTFCLYTQDD